MRRSAQAPRQLAQPRRSSTPLFSTARQYRVGTARVVCLYGSSVPRRHRPRGMTLRLVSTASAPPASHDPTARQCRVGATRVPWPSLRAASHPSR